METSIQVQMVRLASFEIYWMNCVVLELGFGKLHLSSMKNSATNSRLNAQVRKKRDHAKSISNEPLLYIEAKMTSLYLSPPTDTQDSFRLNPSTQDIGSSNLYIGHTRSFRFCSLTARVFITQDRPNSSIYRCLWCLKLVMEISVQVTSSRITVSRQYWDKSCTENYLSRYVRRCRVVATNSISKRSADVHRLVSKSKTTTASGVAIIVSICCTCLLGYANDMALVVRWQ